MISGISLDSFINRPQLLFDMGSSNTRVGYLGKIVFNEPTCLAIHTQTKSVLAIGAKAASLLGKTPDSIQVVFPIKDGAVASEEHAVLFIDAVIKATIPSDLMNTLLGFSGMAVVPSQLSPVEQQVWRRVFQRSGFQSNLLLANVQALYATITEPKALTHSICVLDIGGQKTDIGVLSAGEVVVARTYKSGGIDTTQAVQDILLREQMFVIGWQTAEHCKRELATVLQEKGKDKKLVIRGKDAHHNIAKTMTVSSSMFREEMQIYANQLLQYILRFFSQVPSELATSILERGLYITGGGSQLTGLSLFLQEQLKTEIVMLKEPQISSIKGAMRHKR